MITKPLVMLVALILLSAPGQAQDENMALAAALKEVLSSQETNAAGDYVMGQHSVRITPVSEHAGEVNGKFIAAARFEVTLDGRKADKFTFGAIGIGASLQAARDTAAQEWFGQCGVALFSALNDSPPPVQEDGRAIYPGLTGFRGTAPGDWLDASFAMHRKIFAALKDVIPKADADFHSLNLAIGVDDHGTVTGECRWDGVPSEAILTALKKLSWPTGKGYLFKQTYVVEMGR